MIIVPNFLIVGGQKCGTSWLHSMIAQHPQTFMSRRKELFYFSNSKKHTNFHEYLKNFKIRKYKKVVGESSTSYMWTYDPESKFRGALKNKQITATVKEYLGEDIKILISVRHPIGRAISAFYHHHRMGRIEDNSNFEKYVYDYGIIEYGFFSRHITNWRKEFGEEQVYVSWFEDIKYDPEKMLNDIHSFLELRDFEYNSLKAKKNAGHGLLLTAEGNIKPNKPNDDNFKKLPVVTPKDLDLLLEIYKNEIVNMQQMFPKRCANWDDITMKNAISL